MENKLKGYLDSGKYLPDFMEDFHDQKNLFKRLDVINQNRSDNYTKNISWTEAHVYTVDIFMWYMAAHGYTLQKSRKEVPFYDVDQDLAEFERSRQEEQAKVLKQLMNKSNS